MVLVRVKGVEGVCDQVLGVWQDLRYCTAELAACDTMHKYCIIIMIDSPGLSAVQ